MSPEAERQGLTRERLVEAALAWIREEGLDGLSMRALADQLAVKAASLYWHVRDRRELVELLADAILESVRASKGATGWREAVRDIAAALARRVAAIKDADRILLEVPEAIRRSDVYAQLRRQLEVAGLHPGDAGDVAFAVMIQVITSQKEPEGPALKTGATASIAIDSGSRGVAVRSGSDDMQDLIRVAHSRSSAAPSVVVRGNSVIVRRLRGEGFGEIELNPRHPWRFQIQGATWNSVIDAGGLDVREVKFDSGAAKVEVFLPIPRGVVPIDISSGVVGVTIHRPASAAVIADIHTGAVRMKLDDYSSRAVIIDTQWKSVDGASTAPDRYEMRVNSGVVQLTVDSAVTSTLPIAPPASEPTPAGQPASALEILLDGVEARVRGR